MQNHDIRLKRLEAKTLQDEPVNAQRIFEFCQGRGFAVSPVGQLNTAQWLAGVPTETLRTIINDHTPEAYHAKP